MIVLIFSLIQMSDRFPPLNPWHPEVNNGQNLVEAWEKGPGNLRIYRLCKKLVKTCENMIQIKRKLPNFPGPSPRRGPPKKGLIRKLIRKFNYLFLIFLGYAFPKKTWSGWSNYVLGPESSDSSSKTTYIVLFLGRNLPIQDKISQFFTFSVKCRVQK